MVRAVSVPAALESVGYPADVEAEFVLGVADSLSSWNDGAFRIAVDGGEAAVEPVEADPDAEVGVGPLSQLLVGYRTADSLSETGELSGEPGAIDALDRLFPPRDPFLRERF
jgi:predicted acetyltransferase